MLKARRPSRCGLFPMDRHVPPLDRETVKRTLARNTVWNYLGFGVNVATNLLLFPFVVGRLGQTAAGIWLLLGSLTGYMGLFELGIVPALTQHVAAALARGDREAVNRATSTALGMLAGLMLVASQVLWLIPLLVAMLKIPDDFQHDATMVFAVAIVGFVLKMPLAPFQALLLGSQRQDRCNQLWICLAATKALLTVLVLLAGHGVVAIVTMEALSYLLTAPLQLKWVLTEIPDLRVSWRLISRREATHLASFGGTLLGLSVCSLIIEQTDRFVIGAFLPIANVTHYAAAWKLYMLAFAVPTILLQAVAPIAARLHGQGDVNGLRTLLLGMTKYSVAVALPVSLGLAVSAGTLLNLWMGPAFVDARTVLQILTAAFVVSALNHAGYSVLIGTRQVGPTLWRYFAPQAFLNLGLSLWLVGPLGIEGVALGTAVPALLLELPYLSFLLRTLRVSWREFGSAAIAPVLLPAAVAFAPLFALYWALGPLSTVLPVVALLSAAGHLALFWILSLTSAERSTLLALVRHRLWSSLPSSSSP